MGPAPLAILRDTMTAAPSQAYDLFATCPRNTEGLLLEELQSLGASSATETRSGVSFSGPLSLAYRSCLWSRVASRVLLRLVTCPFAEVEDLYAAAHGYPWEDHLAPQGTLAVEATSTISRGPLAQVNTHFIEQRVKDAVVDRFRDRASVRPNVDLARPDVRINVHLAPGEASFGLDLSGDGLHRRGYRLESGQAPLKENLAAAVLLRSGWPAMAASGGALLDPMCGSGTLLVEGAWIAADVAPGLLRDYFGFLRWLGFARSEWEELLAEARERREAGLRDLPPIAGYDIDKRAMGRAQANARQAGLAGRLLLARRALDDLQAPGTKRGLVITNPPYGKRMGEVDKLISTYEQLGEGLKANFTGWDAAIFTGNPDLGAYLGLRAHKVNTFYNGPLECKLLLFRIGQAHRDGKAQAGDKATAESHIASPALSAGAQMFANRVTKNLRHLRKWAAREGVTCYRLYDADLPDYALAVDVYEDWAHVQEYAPPRTVDPVRARRRLREAMAVVPEILEIPPDQAVLKIRRQQRGLDQYQKLGDQSRYLEVREGGLRFLVNLNDYLDTGLFLDHRPTRALIRDSSAGKRFLNLFAYTGSATVYAAAGGATSTTTVDLSATYLEWAQRNLALNDLKGPKHNLVRADCLEWLAHEGANARTYDLIFMDVPTFSNSKAMSETLDIQRDHARLVRAAAGLLSEGGVLLFSTNFRRFKLNPALQDEFAVDDITKQTLPQDFSRNPRIHRCFRICLRR